MTSFILFFILLFSTDVVFSDVNVFVMEGHSVTLNTDVTEIKRDDMIRWIFEPEDNLIAEINRAAGVFSTYDGVDGRFRNRLQLNHQTGSLTITNITTTQSGLYKFKMTNSTGTSHKIFNVIVVFGDVNVFVMEGDSVTLHTDVTEIQRDDMIQWIFEPEATLLARIDRIDVYDDVDERFRDRLQLDHQTGSLTIRNVTDKHSGHYMLRNISSIGTFYKIFNVIVEESDGMRPVSVMAGDTFILHISVNETQRYDVIHWIFQHGDFLVAKIDRNFGIFSTPGSVDGRFRNRLHLDHQTGSLIITNIRNTDSGLYEVNITSSSRHTIHKTFNVTVSGAVKIDSVMEGDSITLETFIHELLRDDKVLWMFEQKDPPIAKIDNVFGNFSTSAGADGRFRGRLQLNHQTGSLTISDIKTEHSGLYHVDVSGSKHTILKKFNVIVSASGVSPGVVAGIIVGLLVVAVVVGMSVCHYRKTIQNNLYVIYHRVRKSEGEGVE